MAQDRPRRIRVLEFLEHIDTILQTSHRVDFIPSAHVNRKWKCKWKEFRFVHVDPTTWTFDLKDLPLPTKTGASSNSMCIVIIMYLSREDGSSLVGSFAFSKTDQQQTLYDFTVPFPYPTEKRAHGVRAFNLFLTLAAGDLGRRVIMKRRHSTPYLRKLRELKDRNFQPVIFLPSTLKRTQLRSMVC